VVCLAAKIDESPHQHLRLAFSLNMEALSEVCT
jgi:hypothetical protein